MLNSPYANIVGNEVETAGGQRDRPDQGDYATVSGNTIGLVGENGIEVLQAPRVIVSDNTILDALGDGILLTDAADATVTGNAIGLAGQHGIELIDTPGEPRRQSDRRRRRGRHRGDGGDRHRDPGYVIGSAGGDGIHVTQGAETRIVANEIGEAMGNGITLSEAAEAIISDNRIGTVGADGIWVGVATNATVESNVIATAGGRGIGSWTASRRRCRTTRSSGPCWPRSTSGHGQRHLDRQPVLASGGDGIRVASAGHAVISGNHWIGSMGTASSSGTRPSALPRTPSPLRAATQSRLRRRRLLVSRNTIARAIGNGIEIQGSDLAGSLLENSITDAQTGLQMVLTGVFEGVISDNTLLASRVYGMSLETGEFATDSLVSTNWIESSGREGLRILATGPGESRLIVTDNVLILNDAQDGEQQREFVAGLASGAGPMIVELRGTRYNLVPPGDFNFDFFNAGGSTLLYVTDPGAPNVGLLGSSDGSVPPP